MRVEPKPITAITRDSKEPAAAPAKPATSGASVVALSQAGAAVARSTDSHEVNAKIARVRELLERGAYAVDLDKLAASIVDDEMARGSG